MGEWGGGGLNNGEGPPQFYPGENLNGLQIIVTFDSCSFQNGMAIGKTNTITYACLI